MGINLENPEPQRRGRQRQILKKSRKVEQWMKLVYAAALTVLIILPVGASLSKVTGVPVIRAASLALLGNTTARDASPFTWVDSWLKGIGIRPVSKTVWEPSGVDYGNTMIPRDTVKEQLYLAWQYRPKKLDTVPPGVNVLSPTWFYVEELDGKAVVNDLTNLIEGKVSGWNPSQYIQTAHEGGAQVWASVVSFTPELSKQIVTDAVQRGLFLDKLRGWVSDLGLDGINFDFEKMDPADKQAFTALIAECKKKMPQGTVISVDITVPLVKEDPKNWWQCYDRKGLGEAADYVAVMTYDNPDLEPVAAIQWVNEKVRAMLELVPADKLLMGIPFFGVEYQYEVPEGMVLKTLPQLTKSLSRKTVTPATISALVSNQSYTSGKKKIEVQYWIDSGSWSEELGMTSYAFVDKDNMLHVMYCEDAESLLLKGKLLTYNRLAGAAVWRMEFGSTELWNSLSNGMAQR